MDELSSPPEVPRYRPGDTIEMEVEISHRARMHINSIEVRFRTDSDEGTNLTELVLTGVFQPPRENPQSQDTSTEETPPEGTSWSVARVRKEVSLSHAPGVYHFFSIIVNTVGGMRFLLEDDEITLGLFDSSFEVIRGAGRPKILIGKLVH